MQSPSTNRPWATGPGEILGHGLELLRRDSDKNRRLAFISIDNSVELMVKTFLTLPTRITHISVPRHAKDEMRENFHTLLDSLEKAAPDRLNGLDIGELQWYHGLRNQLYHQGNGLTVVRQNVENYAALAGLLFRNLFGYDIQLDEGADLLQAATLNLEHRSRPLPDLDVIGTKKDTTE